MGKPVIRCEGVTKRFGATEALRGVDLVVEGGEVFGYLRSNGAGKTTTLRIIMGLTRATTSRVELFGLDAWARRDELHRRVGYVPGDVSLYPRLTGQDHVDYLGHLHRIGRPAGAGTLGERLDLDLRKPVRQLSRGNRQKLALLRSATSSPCRAPTCRRRSVTSRSSCSRSWVPSSSCCMPWAPAPRRWRARRSRRTLDLLLSTPVTRSRVVVDKALAMVVGTLGLSALLGLALVAEGALVGMDLPAGNAAAMFHLALLGLVFGALALAIGAGTGRLGLSRAVPVLVAVMAYVVNGLGGLVDWLAPVQKLSPLYQYGAHDPLRNGVSWPAVGVAVGTVVLLVAVAAAGFDRRDVTT